MICFDRSRFYSTRDGGVYLKYQQIEELTEELLKDYNPDILNYPQAVDYDDFLECYLEVNVDYQHIYTTVSQGDILGCTLFSEQQLPVFDKEHMCKAYLKYYPITVILDKSLVEGTRKIQENITGLHEAGHVWLHNSIFMEQEGQLRMEDINQHRICCRKEDMEEIEQLKCSNAEMWREWQATTFAVTIALPQKSLNLSVRELFHKYGITGEQLITDDDYDSYQMSYHTIPAELSKLYNISKEAIRYRLEKTGFYTTREKYEAEHAQLTLFDFL